MQIFGGKIYTNSDEIKMYGNMGIMNPQNASFSDLYVNGMIQPPANYRVQKGRLELTAQDAPGKGAPVLLQFVSAFI